VPLRFDDELREDELLLRLVLAAPEPVLALALLAALVLALALLAAPVLALALLDVPRPEADLAPADLAPADLAAVTLAPAAFAPAFLAALFVVLRAVVRDAEAGLAARVVRELDARLAVVRAPALRARGLLAGLRPGVIDLASCSMSLIRDRFVDLASRRSVRRVSATSLYALRAFVPKSARMVCSA